MLREAIGLCEATGWTRGPDLPPGHGPDRTYYLSLETEQRTRIEVDLSPGEMERLRLLAQELATSPGDALRQLTGHGRQGWPWLLWLDVRHHLRTVLMRRLHPPGKRVGFKLPRVSDDTWALMRHTLEDLLCSRVSPAETAPPTRHTDAVGRLQRGGDSSRCSSGAAA